MLLELYIKSDILFIVHIETLYWTEYCTTKTLSNIIIINPMKQLH